MWLCLKVCVKKLIGQRLFLIMLFKQVWHEFTSCSLNQICVNILWKHKQSQVSYYAKGGFKTHSLKACGIFSNFLKQVAEFKMFHKIGC